MVAFVYLLEEVAHAAGESGPWTKIGWSGNPPKLRLNTNLKRGNPRDLTLAAVYEFESEREARDAEGLAHEQFADFAHQKEWFNVPWQKIAEWCEEIMGYKLAPTDMVEPDNNLSNQNTTSSGLAWPGDPRSGS